MKGPGQSLWGIDPESLRGRMPTFLPDVAEIREDVAGVPRPAGMTARSLMPQLLAAGSGQIDPDRTFVITGQLPLGRPGIAAADADAALLERDTFAAYPDMDAGPTKAWLIRHGHEPE